MVATPGVTHTTAVGIADSTRIVKFTENTICVGLSVPLIIFTMVLETA